MVSIWPRRIRDKLWPEPLPPVGCFVGQTVLVTGATGGLGMAAASHFLDFGATVIITSRTPEKGEEAKAEILRKTQVAHDDSGDVRLHVIELDMSSYKSVVDFTRKLEESEVASEGLDIAVLNAGLINIDFVRGPEGWYVSFLCTRSPTQISLGNKHFKSTPSARRSSASSCKTSCPTKIPGLRNSNLPAQLAYRTLSSLPRANTSFPISATGRKSRRAVAY